MSDWHLYLIRTQFGTLYTGITTNVSRRLQEHAGKLGAKYLRSKGPLQIAYQTQIGSHSLALKAEYRIKKLRKVQKEKIINAQPPREELLASINLTSAVDRA